MTIIFTDCPYCYFETEASYFNDNANAENAFENHCSNCGRTFVVRVRIRVEMEERTFEDLACDFRDAVAEFGRAIRKELKKDLEKIVAKIKRTPKE